jgi:hypothetical protein
MSRTFTCQHCGKLSRFNPRLKGKQKYCSYKECQNARINDWKKRQHASNPDYRAKNNDKLKVWRKSYPADQYQKKYRAEHPEYRDRNRELQRVRNKRRITSIVSTTIKPSSLILQLQDDGDYVLSRVKKNMIVKRNALSLEGTGT